MALPAGDRQSSSDDRAPLEAPRRTSRAEVVAEAVEERIVRESLPAGTRLGTRDELGATLGIAPSTLSESIKILETRGRVRTRTGPHGGVFVAEPGVGVRMARTMMGLTGGENEVAGALDVRDLLEEAVIVSAASARHSKRALAPLRRALLRMERAAHPADFFRRNLDFHCEVTDLCANTVLAAVYRSLLELIQSHDPELEMLPGESWEAVRASRMHVHRAIVEAVAAADQDAARAAAAEHTLQDVDR